MIGSVDDGEPDVDGEITVTPGGVGDRDRLDADVVGSETVADLDVIPLGTRGRGMFLVASRGRTAPSGTDGTVMLLATTWAVSSSIVVSCAVVRCSDGAKTIAPLG